jgi:predicted site-specific integrase-resolvase
MDQPPQMPPMGGNVVNNSSNEELIEAIIDEKWNELVKDITKIIEWKNSTETRVSAMEQQMKDIQNSFDKLHQAVVGKIGEYDKHILDVGAEIQAMEKVFAKVLPVFTQNVSELTRVTDDIKGALKK